ncbi:MAG: threonine/serine dehydratase [Pseudomonadota bacterium]
MSAAPAIADLRAAADRIAGRAVRTPLLEAPLLNRAAGRRVLLKAENLQRTGSFKFRGAWSHLSTLDAKTRARGVLAYSSGNHAQGVASAAAELEIPAVIVMPTDAPALKRANTAALGAEVVLYDRAGGESREEVGARLIAERGLHLVKPFDDPLVIAGQGTIGLEIAVQARDAGVTEGEVMVCCGGGGLASGVGLGLEADAPGMRVRPVEPEGFDDWARSLRSGEIQRNAHATGSICDAILTPSPGDVTWPIGRRLFGDAVIVSDRDARRAMAAAARHLKIVLEPGGAVGLAAALFHAAGDAPVIAVASGGNVDLAAYAEWIQFSDWTDEGLPL